MKRQREKMNTTLTLSTPEYSDWTCDIFGLHNQITVRPLKGQTPGWFWRWMQYICFGNLWIKDKK